MEERESGMRLLEALRADAATAHVPAILYTGFHNFLQENGVAIARLNAIPVAKRFELVELIGKIEAALAAAKATGSRTLACRPAAPRLTASG